MPDTAPDNAQDFITDLDVYLFQEGTHRRVFEKLGAHFTTQNGVDGVHFALWAPNADSVAVVGDFNGWDRAAHPMQPRGHTGIWTCFIPGCQVYQAYKYALTTAQGLELPLKADPFAFASELRPATASKIAPALQHEWGDAAHRSHWQNVDARRVPISIYEVHAGSWQRDEHGQFLHWDALAAQLIPYVVEMGFTHIEFMPIAEHPYDPSWGYQVTGLYAPSARFGDAAGFARFVDGAHRAGIGVLLDWVPAHFPLDEHGLARFDGTALYEHEDPRLGFHPDWNTAIYNYGRTEVRGFLINNALFWCEQFHIDGLRVDAVASMLYRDYSRKDGAWIPNAQGGRENWEAVSFLQEVNKAVYGAAPGVMMVAEESTAWPQVTQPVHVGGLGFGFKWNMGFMNDTLRYMARAPIHRRYHHNEISFGLVYAFSENFVLPLSHDEVVHGKGSLLNKMAGDEWQKFANLRAYYAFMWGYPGKKLLFMGQEFAQRNEWCESRALDWHLRQSPAHEGVRNLVKDLNHIYSATPALYARDCEAEGFAWLVVDDADNSVFAWVRQAPGEKPVAVVSNMTPCYRVPYTLPLPQDGVWKEILNSDSAYYGGSGQGNMGQVVAHEGMAEIVLPPLATLWLEWQG